jgi:NAD(P)H-quinone oxidoreductase subunit 5
MTAERSRLRPLRLTGAAPYRTIHEMFFMYMAAVLVAAGPVALMAVGIVPARARATRRFAAAAYLNAATALAALLAVALLGPVESPLLGAAGIGLRLYLDPLSAGAMALIAFAGAVVTRYSITYLAGEAARGRFLRLLSGTLAAVTVATIAGNLATLILAWIGASWTLHGLLLYYPGRAYAVLAARKRFLFARATECALVLAAFAAYGVFHTLDYAPLLHAHATAPLLQGFALAIAIAAMLLSAQFPAHGWLTEVMEAPTPVSALLHAGIVNAGGVLVLRFANVIGSSHEALTALAIVGCITALYGSTVMMTQTSVKGALAHSTIAQMGFMLLECGLGAWTAAFLHIIAHSLYKANAFLRAGSALDGAGVRPPSLSFARTLLVAVPVALVLGATLHGVSPQAPATYALIGIVALGLAQLPPLAAAAAAAAYAMLHALLRGSLGPQLAHAGPAGVGPWCAAALVLAFAGAAWLHGRMMRPGRSRARAVAYTWIANGGYVNTLVNRLLLALWPTIGRPLLRWSAR